MRITNFLFKSRNIYQELQNLRKKIPIIIFSKNDDYIKYRTQESSKDINFQICKYQRLDISSLNNIDYKKMKNYWASYTLDDKSDIFLNAIDKLNTKYREKMIAYTVFSQNKTIEEAEKDSIIDLSNNLHNIILKINDIYKKDKELDYKIDYQPLSGFIGVSTLYNSNNISNLLATIPLLFGNSVFWNPDPNSIITNHLFYEILLESGLPKGILNFVPIEKQLFHKMIINNKNLSCIINQSYNSIYSNLTQELNTNYKNKFYNFNPKIISFESGNNFHFFEKTICNNNYLFEKAVEETFKSAYDFSGQNYNSCKRIYLPYEYYKKFIYIFKKLHNNSKYDNYSIINKSLFLKNNIILRNYQKNILIGGNSLIKNNYYVEPTLLLADDENCELLKKNFEGPILTLCLYKNESIENTMMKCNENSINCLTGSFYTNNEIYKNLSKKTFTNIEDVLLINKSCNINLFNPNILNNFYKLRFID